VLALLNGCSGKRIMNGNLAVGFVYVNGVISGDE
jgi:hypothetical protein